ncbi:hypothetical protein EB118_06770 [bacterium]|nr:hypothetical protein [bacterium]NDC94840.1 hypothetical protein [bacterium]NDD84960.1 hypothetical protein [bacterium]NDG29782.1 hypothetical protein [bacterium]
MTTKIADIYDTIVTKLETILPGFQRVPNPYALDENTAILLRKAFGLAIGPGTNTERYVGCIATWERDYTIGLVTQVVNTENDTLGRAMVEKDIIDAHREILLAFETDSTLDGQCIKAVITDDSGINYIQGVESKYLALEITLRVEYQEPI